MSLNECFKIKQYIKSVLCRINDKQAVKSP